MKRICSSLAVLALLAVVATAARAETTATSTITQIKVNETSDQKYKLFHGAVWLDYDKETHNYRWGGKHCGGGGLSGENLALLYAAFRERFSVTIEYKLQVFKKKQYRCVTAFTVTRS